MEHIKYIRHTYYHMGVVQRVPRDCNIYIYTKKKSRIGRPILDSLRILSNNHNMSYIIYGRGYHIYTYLYIFAQFTVIFH